MEDSISVCYAMQAGESLSRLIRSFNENDKLDEKIEFAREARQYIDDALTQHKALVIARQIMDEKPEEKEEEKSNRTQKARIIEVFEENFKLAKGEYYGLYSASNINNWIGQLYSQSEGDLPTHCDLQELWNYIKENGETVLIGNTGMTGEYVKLNMNR